MEKRKVESRCDLRGTGSWFKFGCIAIGLVVLLIAAGCGSDSTSSNDPGPSDNPASTTSSDSAESVEGKTFALLSCGSFQPWCATFNSRMEELMSEAGVEVTLLENEWDIPKLVQQANQLIGQKPDLVSFLAINDEALLAPVKKAQAAGIPVLYLNSSLDETVLEDGSAQVFPDSRALGEFAGESMIEGLRKIGLEKANVAVLSGTAATEGVKSRRAGFESVMAEAPEFKIISTQDADWDPVKAGDMARQLFAKYGKDGLHAIRTDTDEMAVTVIEAAKQAGFTVGSDPGDFLVVSTNCTAAGMKSMDKGELFATGTEDPWTQAGHSAEIALQQLRGEEVPKTTVVPEFRVTRETIDEYREVCSK